MTSKTIVLKMLDILIMLFLAVLTLSVAGLPVSRLFHMTTREFREFALFVVFGAMLLMHAIGTSDSAP